VVTSKPIKKTALLAKAGGVVALARLFGISHSAVSQWGETVPQDRINELRLDAKTSHWFTKEGDLRARG
jgi:hypothetical protein